MSGHDYFSEYYINHIVESWRDRTEPNPAEDYLINKYLQNTNKKVLEAGTGGGLLSFYLEELGFREIYAIDIIPEMIQTARARGVSRDSEINFEIADASDLKQYQNEQFDYLIYLGQIFCMIPRERLQEALHEAFRVTKNDGILICSFMDWDARWYNPIVSIMINSYRLITGQTLSKHHIPILKLHGKFNYKHFYSKGCTCYWPKADIIVKKLRQSGFNIEAFYKEEQITSHKGTAFYLVCRKRPIVI